MLIDILKGHARDAMKARDSLATQIYRLALGEVQTLEARASRTATDEDVAAVIRRLIKSNEETLSLSTNEEQKAALTRETALLTAVLPKGISEEDLARALEPVLTQIKEARSDGQAMGVAMKHLKSTGISAQGNEVTAAIARLRK